VTESRRTTPRTFPESLRELERALAATQHAATVDAPFTKDTAGEYLRALETVRSQLADLCAFVERQAN
jgi:hypothetical protein